MRRTIKGVMREDIDFARGINFAETPCFETAFETVEVSAGLEKFREDVFDEFFLVGDAERSAGGEPGDSVLKGSEPLVIMGGIGQI